MLFQLQSFGIGDLAVQLVHYRAKIGENCKILRM